MKGWWSKSPPLKLAKTITLLERDGFCPYPRLSPSHFDILSEWFRFLQKTSLDFRCGEHRGSIKYSSLDFFGERPYYSYLVRDEDRFALERARVGRRVERMFRCKNPRANQHVRRAFTQLMHGNHLHWSKCCIVKGRKQER